MTKTDQFSSLDLQGDFSIRPAASELGQDPRDRGKLRLRGAAKIAVEQIVAKGQVRTEFDPVKHAELVASLRAHGQQQPIRVYWSDEDGKYVVFQGERRFRAAPEAGLTHLDCIIDDRAPTEAERVLLQLIENLIRDDLNPVDEARAFRDVIRLRECSAKDLALEIGRDPTMVQRSVRLLELPADILADVAKGIISKTMIREVQKLKTEAEQRQMIADYKAGESYANVVSEVGARLIRGASSKVKKAHTAGHIKLEATAKRKFTNAELIAALEEWLAALRADGRGRAAA